MEKPFHQSFIVSFLSDENNVKNKVMIFLKHTGMAVMRIIKTERKLIKIKFLVFE